MPLLKFFLLKNTILVMYFKIKKTKKKQLGLHIIR